MLASTSIIAVPSKTVPQPKLTWFGILSIHRRLTKKLIGAAMIIATPIMIKNDLPKIKINCTGLAPNTFLMPISLTLLSVL